MIGDLLDFTRSRLGDGIPIVCAPVSVGKMVHDVVDEVRAGTPQRTIDVEARTGVVVNWDCARISQALANLLSNAVEHGKPETPVTVRVEGNDGEISITIHNEGRPLTGEQLDGIFGSMKSSTNSGQSGPLGHLGLGLYIAERIVHAHGGKIDVDSSESAGTTFQMLIPTDACRG